MKVFGCEDNLLPLSLTVELYFGGMAIEIMTMLVVPVLYCAVQERKLAWGIADPRFAEHPESAGATAAASPIEPDAPTEEHGDGAEDGRRP